MRDCRISCNSGFMEIVTDNERSTNAQRDSLVQDVVKIVVH